MTTLDSMGAVTWPRDGAGEFLVAGQPLSRVVDVVGGTPCYLYDRARIAARAIDLRLALSPHVRVHYAMKANPMPAVVGLLAGLVDGFDVASAGELRVALDAGMTADRISLAGPGKSERELVQAVTAGVLVNVESFREVRVVASAAKDHGAVARVAVRVNPPFELRASGMKMAGGPRQFGVDAEAVPALLGEIASAGLTCEGFHLFAGSQNLKAEAIVEAQSRACELAIGWAKQFDLPVRSLNLGGGFGVPYTKDDRPLDVGRVVTHVNALAAGVHAELPAAHLVLELGRYLVAEAGLYVCRVVDRKTSRGQTYLVVDGGMHQHLAASGNLGQVVRKNYPIAINGKAGATETVNVVGPLCTPLDVLASDARLCAAEEGDLVVVFQSGAYGRSASPRSFLGHPDVVEALV
jgi:diaminopimelate decarboxylase